MGLTLQTAHHHAERAGRTDTGITPNNRRMGNRQTQTKRRGQSVITNLGSTSRPAFRNQQQPKKAHLIPPPKNRYDGRTDKAATSVKKYPTEQLWGNSWGNISNTQKMKINKIRRLHSISRRPRLHQSNHLNLKVYRI